MSLGVVHLIYFPETEHGLMMNRVILIGRLGQDPELRQFAEGRSRASFRLATHEKRKSSGSNEATERTQWHRVVAWGKTAELVGAYLSKGRQVCVEGKIQTRKWADKGGKEQFTTEIVANSVTFLGSARPKSNPGLGVVA